MTPNGIVWIFCLEMAFLWWYLTPQKLIVCLASSTAYLKSFSENLPLSALYLLNWIPNIDSHHSKDTFPPKFLIGLFSLLYVRRPHHWNGPPWLGWPKLFCLKFYPKTMVPNRYRLGIVYWQRLWNLVLQSVFLCIDPNFLPFVLRALQHAVLNMKESNRGTLLLIYIKYFGRALSHAIWGITFGLICDSLLYYALISCYIVESNLGNCMPSIFLVLICFDLLT